MNPQIGTQSFTKFCPACKLGNDANSITCKYCGSKLDLIPSKSNGGASADGEYSPPDKGLAFYLSGSTSPIGVGVDDEFILGRKSEDDSGPLVDLTYPDGYAMGVSRRHAMIRATKKGYVIIDLNSSNGTWVDGKILVPTQPYDLPSGASVQLGRLKLVAIYNK